MRNSKILIQVVSLFLLMALISNGCNVGLVDLSATQTAVAGTALAQEATQTALGQAQAALAATQTAMSFTATPTATPTPMPPTAMPEPTDTPTVGPTDTPTDPSTPTDTPTLTGTPTATPTPTIPPTPTDTPTATATPRVVNITGIICKPNNDPIDMKDNKVFLPTRHFGQFGYDHSDFGWVTVTNPLNDNQIEAKIIAFGDSHDSDMRTWDKCDFALKKTMRLALDGGEDGDLDRMANLPFGERQPLTLIFIYTVPTQD